MRRNLVKIIGVIGVLLLVTAVALPIWLGYRTYRQNGLDAGLIAAINHKETIAVRRLLDQGASANATDVPVLHQSLWQCVVAEVKLALHLRRQNSKERGDSALAIAVSKNSTDIVRLLLEHRATGVNEIVSASERYQFLALLRGGTHIGPITGGAGFATTCTLLCTAAQNGNAAIVAGLIQHGASVNASDDAGQTPLHEACIIGSVQVIDILLHARANVESRDVTGDTPLMFAARYDWPKAVVLLLHDGADPSCRTATSTALSCALDSEHYDHHIVQALLKAGASANRADGFGLTPLMRIAMLESPRPNDDGSKSSDDREAFTCLTLVIRDGARVNATVAGGGTALMFASECAPLPVIRCLLKAGAQVNDQTCNGHTALDVAIHGKRKAVIRLLKRYGGKATGKKFAADGSY